MKPLAQGIAVAAVSTGAAVASETFGANVEADARRVLVSKLLNLGGQCVSVGAGLRYWADSPQNVGPDGFGARLVITLLFPKSK